MRDVHDEWTTAGPIAGSRTMEGGFGASNVTIGQSWWSSVVLCAARSPLAALQVGDRPRAVH